MSKHNSRVYSARVSRVDRAGRAPYNFVPLPEAGWHRYNEPPDQSAYIINPLNSGEIELELTALTDFYVRGMWRLDEFNSLQKSVKDQTLPFLVRNRLLIPGSTLRGMIRNLVEILGRAPLDPVNNQQLFYRAVAAVRDPNNRTSFEPQAKTYKDRVAAVRAGYLYGSAARWEIQPALPLPGKLVDRAGYRYSTTETWTWRAVWFEPAGFNARIFDRPRPGTEAGTLVCSGGMRNKRAQWVIRAEDKSRERILIPPCDVEAYKEAGISQELAHHREFVFGDRSRGVPCFFVEYPDSNCQRHVAFGHTPNFRLPYFRSAWDAIPPENRREAEDKDWDMAQAMFGRAPRTIKGCKIPGARGRVFFEDAILIDNPNDSFESTPASVVLGTPKPTTYQHYLVQKSDQVRDALHWDGDYEKPVETIVRGHKLYWHRPNAPIRPADSKQERVSTQVQVAHKGLRFRCTIRYENLRDTELGCLLSAICLPQECAIHLGMGKPLGLGSFRMEVVQIRQIDRAKRYGSFLASAAALEQATELATGILATADSTNDAIEKYCKIFAEFYLSSPLNENWFEELWQDNRLRELRALLDYDGALERGQVWLNSTRYLEFGKLPTGIYNEYLHIGYPKKRSLEKRRALPPATQIHDGGPEIPKDERPPFEGPRLIPNLRRRRQES